MQGVYRIYHAVSGKSYIGSSWNIEGRISQHFSFLLRNKHSNVKLQRAFVKHGKSQFQHEILEEIEDYDELFYQENYWIQHYDSIANGYNIHWASPSSTEIARMKMSNTRKGNPHPNQVKAVIESNKRRTGRVSNRPRQIEWWKRREQNQKQCKT